MPCPRLPLLAAALLAAFAAGCASNEPPPAVVHYPVTYQVPLGGAPVSHVGNPHLDISATQDVSVSPGRPLYLAIQSPAALTVYVYERVGVAPNANLLTHIDVPANQPIRERLVPPTSSLEFLFSNPAADAGGALEMTLSDQPLAGGPLQPPPTFIGQ
ncbi:MAG TPA: hypothetical protein VFE31_10390 [Opitutaceae bacterium]|jgi:hypothetical protein|nr:hypothetical protein [Opitutaceae bacterium]